MLRNEASRCNVNSKGEIWIDVGKEGADSLNNLSRGKRYYFVFCSNEKELRIY
jgi:hypothetical protein